MKKFYFLQVAAGVLAISCKKDNADKNNCGLKLRSSQRKIAVVSDIHYMATLPLQNGASFSVHSKNSFSLSVLAAVRQPCCKAKKENTISVTKRKSGPIQVHHSKANSYSDQVYFFFPFFSFH